MNTVALVLGGYVNGYSIIRELHFCGVKNIWLFDYGKSLARQSNKIQGYSTIDSTGQTLRHQLLKLNKQYGYIVIYPTNDIQLELLAEIYDDIKAFCFVPFNHGNVLTSLNKYVQYSFCEANDIPYPKTQNISTVADVQKIEKMLFPVLIKPNKLYDSSVQVFRGLLIKNIEHYREQKVNFIDYMSKGVEFLASEFIPGDDTNMYSYNGYRNQQGEILNEWVGKKLTQYPDVFGMFCSATNVCPEVVRAQGRKLLECMDLKGICEPEFKYDERDGKYKLMEITIRSTMWHRLGHISGIDINYSLYLDAIGEKVPKQVQKNKQTVHLVYMKHEIINLITREKYWRHFKYNVFGCKKREFSIWDRNDVKPFIFDTYQLIKSLGGVCLRALKLKR